MCLIKKHSGVDSWMLNERLLQDDQSPRIWWHMSSGLCQIIISTFGMFMGTCQKKRSSQLVAANLIFFFWRVNVPYSRILIYLISEKIFSSSYIYALSWKTPNVVQSTGTSLNDEQTNLNMDVGYSPVNSSMLNIRLT